MKTFYTNSIKGLTLLFLLFLSSKGSNAQMVTDFVSKGKIPAVFTETLESKVLKAYETIDSKLSSTELEKRKNELYTDEFYKDYLLKSGLIVFNDDISKYVKRVADELLKDETALKNSLQIYTAKSSIINAICLEDNIIIITTGMFAKLESESELAFMLANKIAHLKNKSYSKIDYANFFLEHSSFLFIENYLKASHTLKQELHADSEAIQMISQSKYSYEGIVNMLNMLEFSHHSVSFEKLNLKPLESECLKIPNYYLDVKVDPIEMNDKDEDIHFDMDKRIVEAKEILTSMKRKTLGELNIQPIKHLKQLQVIAEIENIVSLDSKGYHIKSLYQAIVVLNNNPDNLNLKKCLAASLFSISNYSHKSMLHNNFLEPFFKNIPANYVEGFKKKYFKTETSLYVNKRGEVQRLGKVLERLRVEDVMTIAAAKLFELHKGYPNEEVFKKRLTAVLGMLKYHFDRDSDYYGDEKQWINSPNKTKLDEGDSSVGNQCKYALRAFADSKYLKQYSEEGFLEIELKLKEKELNDKLLKAYDEKPYYALQIKKFRKEFKEKVKVKNVAIYHPFFIYLQDDGYNGGGLVENFHTQKKLSKKMVKRAKRRNLKYQFISTDNIDVNDINAWNDYASVSLIKNSVKNNVLDEYELYTELDYFDLYPTLIKHLGSDIILFTNIYNIGGTLTKSHTYNIIDLKTESKPDSLEIDFYGSFYGYQIRLLTRSCYRGLKKELYRFK